MLDGPPPRWTLRSFFAEAARLPLGGVRLGGCGPTMFDLHEGVRGHHELVELLERYRRELVAAAPEPVQARAWAAMQEVHDRLRWPQRQLETAAVDVDHRIAVLAVARAAGSLIASALAVAVPPPPVAWVAWQALSAGHAVTGLDVAHVAGRDADDLLQRGFVVDVGWAGADGVVELLGAEVAAAEVRQVPDGEQLRLITRRRGAWTIGPADRGLAPTLWDGWNTRMGQGPVRRRWSDLGRVVASRSRPRPGIDEVRFVVEDGRAVVVRRPRVGQPRLARVHLIPRRPGSAAAPHICAA